MLHSIIDVERRSRCERAAELHQLLHEGLVPAARAKTDGPVGLRGPVDEVQRLEQRIQKLRGAVARIFIGAPTEAEIEAARTSGSGARAIELEAAEDARPLATLTGLREMVDRAALATEVARIEARLAAAEGEEPVGDETVEDEPPVIDMGDIPEGEEPPHEELR